MEKPPPRPGPPGGPAAPGLTAPASPPAAGRGSTAVLDLAAGGTAAAGTMPKAAGMNPGTAADTAPTARKDANPPSSPMPGRKIRPRPPAGTAVPTPPRRTLPGAADGPSTAGEAPRPLEPAIPAAMCRLPPHPSRARREQADLSRLEVPGPASLGQHPEVASPIPAPLERRPEAASPGPVQQVRRRKPPRQSTPAAHGPARQEPGPPASPPAPPILRAAVRRTTPARPPPKPTSPWAGAGWEIRRHRPSPVRPGRPGPAGRRFRHPGQNRARPGPPGGKVRTPPQKRPVLRPPPAYPSPVPQESPPAAPSGPLTPRPGPAGTRPHPRAHTL